MELIRAFQGDNLSGPAPYQNFFYAKRSTTSCSVISGRFGLIL